MRAVVVGEVLGFEEMRLVEARCHAEGEVMTEMRFTGDVGKGHDPGVTMDLEIETAPAFEDDRQDLLRNLLGGVRDRGRRAGVRNRVKDTVFVSEIAGPHLQLVGGNSRRFPHDLPRRLVHGRTTDRHRSRIERTGAERHGLRVTFHDFDVVNRYAQSVGCDLAEAGRVALTGALGAAEYRRVTVGVYCNTGAFVAGSPEPDRAHRDRRANSGAFRKSRKSYAEMSPLGAQPGLLAPQLDVARTLQRFVHVCRVVARVESEPGG